ncbi:General secretion pathway protein K [Marinomonas aquimarina]|uniref:Type II secretion system protein K n=1 Tax=Marinomonas aquimarina TaxID=295068 RepID=A0A1A8TI71_9GAMM|nr:type II secretion system minor pseudopilin GspK [Marinomonas aquimarina]SBS32445.1 General secretion pathway protein K [Marinomonas aquimarina]
MKTHQQRGVVLIMALMVLAVVASLSVYTIQHVQRSLSVTTFSNDNVGLRQQLLGGEAWASAWLAAQHGTGMYHAELPDLDRPWHLLRQHFELDGPARVLQIDVIERQSCINLNLLADPTRAAITEQRLDHLSNALSLDSAWIAVVKDWLDRDQALSSASSHEDEYYLALEPAFRTADSPLVNASELGLLAVPKAVFARLAPYICWLPEAAPININQLNEPLLKAYFPGLKASAREALLARLSSSGFDTVADFLAWPELAEQNLVADEWHLESRYVDVYVTLSGAATKRALHSRLQRLSDGRVVPFARAFGPFDVLSTALLPRHSKTI